MRLALFTTFFPAVAKWLPAWAESVAAQTDTDFDLCVALDGMTAKEAVEACGMELGARWYEAGPGVTPAGVRSKALLAIVGEYDGVLFVDADDVLLPTRVEAGRDALIGADASCCAMFVVDEAGLECGPVFEPADGFNELHRLNVFGFTNSAYRSEALKACLPIPDSCVLVDWFVASTVALKGGTMHTDSTPRMQYRQYGANTARILSPFSQEQVLAAATLVARHYDLLEEFFEELPYAHTGARDQVHTFIETLQRDAKKAEAYVEALNALDQPHVWWSCVAHPQLERTWKS